MMQRNCLNNEQLLVAATTGLQESARAAHLQSCRGCRRRLQRLTRERQLLSAAAQAGGRPSVSTSTGQAPPCASQFAQFARRAQDVSAAAEDPPLSDRRRIGKYLALERIRRGGQGVVYRGWDPALRREVAIKVSRAPLEGVSPKHCRVVREGRLLARIDHPHLARVYDCGVHEQRPFLVLEFVRGATLRDWAASRSLTAETIRRLIGEISSAVAATHAHGILHLDLKPENVMVGEDGKCKLVDFGLAGILDQPRRSPFRIVAGTLGFMAPEQLSGDASEWTPATDVFGLGGVLFFLLTGGPPRSGDSSESGPSPGIADIAGKLQRSQADPHLARICLQALAEDPAQRFANAAAFRRAIVACRFPAWRALSLLCLLLGAILLAMGLCMNMRVDTSSASQAVPVAVTAARQFTGPVRVELRVVAPTAAPLAMALWSPALGLLPVAPLDLERQPGAVEWYPRQADQGLPVELPDPVLALIVLPDRGAMQRLRQLPCFQPGSAMANPLPAPPEGRRWEFSSRAALPLDDLTPGELRSVLERVESSLKQLGTPYACSVASWPPARLCRTKLRMRLFLPEAFPESCGPSEFDATVSLTGD